MSASLYVMLLDFLALAAPRVLSQWFDDHPELDRPPTAGSRADIEENIHGQIAAKFDTDAQDDVD